MSRISEDIIAKALLSADDDSDYTTTVESHTETLMVVKVTDVRENVEYVVMVAEQPHTNHPEPGPITKQMDRIDP